MSFETREDARVTRASILRDRSFRRIAWFAIVLIGLAAHSAQASVNTFSQVGPEGGRIADVVYHPTDPSIVYVAGGPGIYRSTNGGESWVLISELENTPWSIAVHPSNPTRLFITVPGEGVYTSEDSGASLSQLSSFPVTDGNIPQASFSADGSILYVVVDDRMLRSTDLGSTWEEGGSVPLEHESISSMRVDPVDPDVLYVTTFHSNAYRSTDRGLTWTLIDLPEVEGGFIIAELDIVDPDTQRLWVAGQGGVWFRDPGSPWTNTNFPAGGSTMLTVDPRNPARVYAAGYWGLNALPAVGEEWINIHGDARTSWISSLAIHPTNADRLLLGGAEGLAESFDGGVSWTTRNNGVHATEVVNLVSAPISGRIFLSSTSNGLHWIDTETLAITALNNEQLRDLGPYPGRSIYANPVHVIPGAEHRLFASTGNGIVRSSDTGQNWQLLQNDMLDNFLVRSIASASTEQGERVLVLTEDGLYGSMNNGDTWQLIEIPNIDWVGDLITVASSNRSVVLVNAYRDNEAFVVKSDDGGSTWTELEATTSIGVYSIAVDANDADLIYVRADQKLMTSTNGGVSWSEVPSFVYDLALDPRNPQIMYASEPPNLIVRSVDRGETWQPLAPSGLSQWSAVSSMLVDPDRPHHLFVAYDAGGVKYLSIEPDLILEVSAPSQADAGEEASLVYTVTNDGPFDATGVVATIELPSAAENVSVNASVASCTQEELVITCTIPVLRTSETTDIVVKMTRPDTGVLEIEASISGDQPDPVSENGSVSSEIEIVQPSTPPPPAPSPPPSRGGSGGGGGSTSLLMIAIVASLSAARRKAR